MAISRAQMLKELEPGLNRIFGTNYAKFPEQHGMIYEESSSDRNFEEDLKLSGFGIAPVKNEGAAVTYDSLQEMWTARYVHDTIALAFSVTEEAMEDNLYQSISARGTKALARAMAETKALKSVLPLNTGFTSYQTGDGQYLFSTAHPRADGGTIANRPVTGADLNETSLEAAAIAIAKWVDDRGLLMNVRIKRVIIPPDLEFTAERVLNNPNRPATSDRDINALYQTKRIPGGYGIMNYLTDTNAWFLTTTVDDGARHFKRVGMKTGMSGDFDTGNVRYKARERYSFGFSDPLSMYGSPGSS